MKQLVSLRRVACSNQVFNTERGVKAIDLLRVVREEIPLRLFGIGVKVSFFNLVSQKHYVCSGSLYCLNYFAMGVFLSADN